jgi:tyrosinase
MANGLTIRKEVLQLEATELAALRDAYQKMMAFSATDNRGWLYWAGYHGIPNWYCWHHGRVGQANPQPVNLFLPWHRAYLLYFEHVARDQNSGAVIPWWDWSSQESHGTGVPPAFSAETADGGQNPLFKGPVVPVPGEPARSSTLRFPGLPEELPSSQRVEQALQLDSFTDFCLQVEEIHDDIHGWTGGVNPAPPPNRGDMARVATAAFDPIFWSHHAMIDRVWYLWQLRHGINNIPPEYLDLPLRPFSLKVADVLNIRRLGYEYAVSEVSVVVP